MSTRAKKDKKKQRQTKRQNETERNLSLNTSMESHDDEASQHDDTLGVILRELRDFRQDNKTQLVDIKEEITKTNTRLDEAEGRITKAEDRIQNTEEILSEMLKAQMEAKLTDQESRSRRENIRIYGIPEEAEKEYGSINELVEKLLGDNLDISDTASLQIERAHRALGPQPPPNAQPRSILVKFSSFRAKETILRKTWQRKGLIWQEKRINVDNDYPPRILQRRKEYAEVRRILRDRGIPFQTMLPAKLKVKYSDGAKIYETVEGRWTWIRGVSWSRSSDLRRR